MAQSYNALKRNPGYNWFDSNQRQKSKIQFVKDERNV